MSLLSVSLNKYAENLTSFHAEKLTKCRINLGIVLCVNYHAKFYLFFSQKISETYLKKDKKFVEKKVFKFTIFSFRNEMKTL